MSTGEAVRDYFARLRAGELGALPSLFGLLVLVILFSALSDNFLTPGQHRQRASRRARA